MSKWGKQFVMGSMDEMLCHGGMIAKVFHGSIGRLDCHEVQ